jgi:heme/copper-type cytochrome/quinol oxidase subunit 3
MNTIKYPKHLFHVLEPSLWPFFLASGIFFFVTGLAFSMHYVMSGYYILLLGFLILVITAIFWFLDISREAVVIGYHTQIVRKGLKTGFLFFIASEIMLFFGFFWAFFHAALSPTMDLGSLWPPSGLKAIGVFDYPLFNTFILIFSGFSVTWAHRGLALGSFKDTVDGFVLTLALGLLFIVLQGLEYYESTFNLQDGVYTSAFFLLTGLHGCHVIVGVGFLFFCLLSLLFNHFLTNHYLRFVFAVWYWHFVDIVWILLFLTLYCWGSW